MANAMRISNQMRTASWIMVAVLIGGVSFIAANRPRTVSPNDIEQAHGVLVPLSAKNFQQKRSGFALLDYGILSLFEISTDDLNTFLKQLNVTAKSRPRRTTGSPLENGWNVWRTDRETFVPGNTSLSGLKKTWSGAAKPIEMLSCKSTKGDWLHVEVWAVNDHRLELIERRSSGY